MKHRHLIALVAVTMIALSPITQARADMAPPEPPAGGSLDTGEPSTYVRMVSEDVLITVGDGSADVTATFNMLNMGTEEEILDVLFPAGYNWGNSAKGTYPILGLDIDSFVVHVNEENTDFTIAQQPNTPDVWTTWRVTFPPGQLVKVEVTYQGLPEHDPDVSFPIYSYILHTGVGWYGSIGEGIITIRLPYEINEYNILADAWVPQPPFYAINGTDIIWHFTDLEPDGLNDISVAAMPLDIWLGWQAAEKAVNESPDSVSHHLELAHALRRAASYSRSRTCDGNCALFDRARQEYKLWLNVVPDGYVLQVIPGIVDYHLDYIDMLQWSTNDWDSLCQEIEKVIALAPTDKRVLEHKSDMENYNLCPQDDRTPTPTLYAPPGCDPQAGRCPPPTATPTTTPSSTSTPRPTRTLTLAPTQTVTPTPIPTPIPPSGDGLALGALVGIAVVVIAGAGIGMWAARRKAASR